MYLFWGETKKNTILLCYKGKIDMYNWYQVAQISLKMFFCAQIGITEKMDACTTQNSIIHIFEDFHGYFAIHFISYYFPGSSIKNQP